MRNINGFYLHNFYALEAEAPLTVSFTVSAVVNAPVELADRAIRRPTAVGKEFDLRELEKIDRKQDRMEEEYRVEMGVCTENQILQYW